jgi:adenosylcobinamide-GDP ribazoletransferase
MKPSIQRFLSTFTLMSRVPINTSVEADLSSSDFWIPAISPFVSAAALAGFGAASFLFGSLGLAIAGSIAVQYLLFNLFHLDGLVDSADALLPLASREKRFEILKDPRIGTYGFFAGALCLLCRIGALDSIARNGALYDDIIPALLVAPLAGRLAAALLAWKSKPAKNEGLGAAMKGFSPGRIALGAAAALVPVLTWMFVSGHYRTGIFSLIALLPAAAAAAMSMGRLYSKKLEGFTGDALGAAIELGEVGFLLLFTIAIRFASM